jgi:hypothetical protein
MEYNSKIYLELLRYDQSLKKNGNSLQEQDKAKYLKLLNYSVKVSDHVHWQQKSEYLNVMKNFVDLKINGKQFVSQFNKIHRANEEAVKMLKTDLKQLNIFQPNPKSFGFTEWTSEIDLGCDEFYPDFQLQDRVEFAFARDEENFRTFVADIIPQMQKYCEE